MKPDFLSRDHIGQNAHADHMKVVGELEKADVLKRLPGRSQPSFQKEDVEIFSPIDAAEFHDLLEDKKQGYNNKLEF